MADLKYFVFSICVVKTIQAENVLNFTCGRQLIDPTERLNKGSLVVPGDWPWHVAIILKETGTNGLYYQCGGSIISKTAVVTAGHCVILNGIKGATDLFIIIGGTNTFTQVGYVGRQTPIVKEVLLHPNYDNPSVSTSDLAIFIVDSFTYTEYVQPICIWGPKYNGKAELFGKTGVVMGRLVYPDNTVSDDMLIAAYVMVQDDWTCFNMLPSEYGRLLTEFTLCAGGLNSTTNVKKGDSGSGLYIPVMQQDHKVRWFLRGVLSKCFMKSEDENCDPGMNPIFTDVGPHYGWIFHHSGLELSNKSSTEL